MMKKTIGIVLLLIVGALLSLKIGYDTADLKSRIEYNEKNTFNEQIAPRPEGHPLTTCNGDSIEWTWLMARQYRQDSNNIQYRYDSTGTCVEYVVIKITKADYDAL